MAKKNVLIIGGGAAGLAAARALSTTGASVHIVEKSGFLGGHAIGYTCKAAEECLQCGACSVEKLLKEVSQDDGITVHLNTTIKTVKEKDGFSVSLKKGPVYINPDKCTNCGVCYEKSPVAGAVQRGYSSGNHPLYAVNPDLVAESGELEKICPEGAIDLAAKTTSKTLTFKAVILASGFKAFDPGLKKTYGYENFPNVISGLDLERIKRENGLLVRPSDGQAPRKIAFIQCVGSRDERLGNLWCSRVCCPYALRSARSIKHKEPETEVTVFYMDIQNIGKEFPVFHETCRDSFRFIRSIPVDVFPGQNDSLSIRFFDEDGLAVPPAEEDEEGVTPEPGRAVYDTFDLLVLSVGITPNPDNRELAEQFGLKTDQDGFIKIAGDPDAATTDRQGVFVAGTAHQPKTIEASIAQAGKAAQEAMKYLGE
ncbi:MAG: FAD-dependent oxidoreductase [Desulfosudaceae bacterium]